MAAGQTSQRIAGLDVHLYAAEAGSSPCEAPEMDETIVAVLQGTKGDERREARSHRTAADHNGALFPTEGRLVGIVGPSERPHLLRKSPARAAGVTGAGGVHDHRHRAGSDVDPEAHGLGDDQLQVGAYRRAGIAGGDDQHRTSDASQWGRWCADASPTACQSDDAFPRSRPRGPVIRRVPSHTETVFAERGPPTMTDRLRRLEHVQDDRLTEEGEDLGEPRVRAASIAATDPLHISARTSVAAAVGVNRVLRLDARQPLAELVSGLNAFQPQVLFGYPSTLALLADEQQAGRLRLGLTKVTTVSEVRTPVERKISEAWRVAPFNWYGISEGGVLAADCRHHEGMHVFEDLFLVENVDEEGRPVPDGVVGGKLLLTNLFNRTQPIIRYELSDMVVLDSRPCPCGRSFRRVVRIEGRTSEILRFRRRQAARSRCTPSRSRARSRGCRTCANTR
jgi:hypothetical protein